ncbi:MAG TPA: RagB/SusD family nutrient uptake outer membrane protein [Longimicrobiales bacterium]|nr:RagB/SusD family nutrient uptake outer membrane protein [Longimicrobiales bacterium]
MNATISRAAARPRAALPAARANERAGRRLPALALLGALLCAACSADKLEVPDLNNPSIESLEQTPTPSAVAAAAQGLLIGARIPMGVRNGYISLLGILGRESYVFDPADPRFVAEMLESPLDAGSPAFGANLWNQRYQNLRTAAIVLAAVTKVGGFSDAQKEAVRGFTKTMMAYDLLLVINTRDNAGAVIQFDAPPDQPAPIASRTEVFNQIVTLLDEAKAHLQKGGDAFPFRLSTGFTGFSTPATFLKFNRALRARVADYMGSLNIGGTTTNFQAALQALQESFIDPTGALDLGVYHVFSTGSGDTQNTLLEPVVLAHPSLERDVEKKANGQPDDRFTAKLRRLDATAKQRGLETSLGFRLYQSQDAPIPIIRNEELILLRAEANIGLGNIQAAAQDINLIRQRSGGLPARTDLTAANILDELLRQRRYSLLFEGDRWVDLRRYNRLTDALKDLPTHVVNRQFPIPIAECLARGQTTCG